MDPTKWQGVMVDGQKFAKSDSLPNTLIPFEMRSFNSSSPSTKIPWIRPMSGAKTVDVFIEIGYRVHNIVMLSSVIVIELINSSGDPTYRLSIPNSSFNKVATLSVKYSNEYNVDSSGSVKIGVMDDGLLFDKVALPGVNYLLLLDARATY